jgi:hypothetical protein
MASLDPSILEELQDEGTSFPYTCVRCVTPEGLPARGDISSELYYDERYKKRHGLWSEGDYYNAGQVDTDLDFLPDRCWRCNRAYCKYKNTKKQIYLLNDYTHRRRGEYAKMITVALPSRWNGVRDKFHLHAELMQRWTKLYRYLVENQYITGGIYVREMTQKVSFDGFTKDWNRKTRTYDDRKIGEPDPFGIHKFHAHIHAVVDMPTYRGAALAAFGDLGPKFGLGRLTVTYHKYNQSHWEIKHDQARYLAKYTSKDFDCGRQATFGSLIGYRMPSPLDGQEKVLQETLFEED